VYAKPDAHELAVELRSFLDQHPLVEDPVEVLVRGLLDILDLPIWKRRHELYAAHVSGKRPAARGC
jgi:hypothetical protein